MEISGAAGVRSMEGLGVFLEHKMKNLKFEEAVSEDSLELRFNENTAWLEIDEPLAGDTEAGFGRTCSFTLRKDQARKIAQALLEWADA